jgi:hypothetical protein
VAVALVVWPYVQRAGIQFWEHVKKQEPHVIMAYVALILGTILVIWIRRWADTLVIVLSA